MSGLYWIPEEDTGCRMWKCPKCGGRLEGHPMNFSTRDFNPYHFCAYCGTALETKRRQHVGKEQKEEHEQ